MAEGLLEKLPQDVASKLDEEFEKYRHFLVCRASFGGEIKIGERNYLTVEVECTKYEGKSPKANYKFMQLLGKDLIIFGIGSDKEISLLKELLL